MRDQHLWEVGRLRAHWGVGRGRGPGSRARPKEASGNPRGQSEDWRVLQICSKLKEDSQTCVLLPDGPLYQERGLGGGGSLRQKQPFGGWHLDAVCRQHFLAIKATRSSLKGDVMGWIVSTKKYLLKSWHWVPWNVTFLGNGVFTEVMKFKGVYDDRPQSNMTRVFIKRGKLDTGTDIHREKTKRHTKNTMWKWRNSVMHGPAEEP